MRTSTRFASLAGGCLLFLGAHAAAAQEAPPETPAPAPEAARPAGAIERRVGFELITGAIGGEAAEDAGTGSRLWGAQVNVAFTAYRVLSLSGDLGIVGMRDGRQFSQETTVGEQSSGVAAGMATLAAGVRTPPLALHAGEGAAAVSAGVSAGHSWLNANRTIANCYDCHGEDVQIGAGDFWEPALHVSWGRRVVSARYRMYGSGSDVRDAVMIGLSGAF
jgi:hypothetical protein